MDLRILLSTLFIFSLIQTHAQEYESGLIYNPGLQQKMVLLKKASSADTLTLPFFDDFPVTSDPYPDSRFWMDKSVFINSNYESNPISTGVATFDALDEAGNVYDIKSSAVGTDTLTSNPIDLSGKQDVFLSFFYQPEGLGDTPEGQDSLKLEFKNLGDTVWTSQFQVGGTSLQPFKQVILPVDAPYLYNGFQFRFVNKASITIDNDLIGSGGNADHWNLDYVFLDDNRSPADTTYNDVTITTPVPGIFQNYESIPWNHFSVARPIEMAPKLPISVRNLNHEEDDVLQININYYYRDNNDPDNDNEEQYGWFNLKPQFQEDIPGDLIYDFESSTTNNAEFYIRLNLLDDAEDLNIHHENDTIERVFKLQDYYSYDDGTPEAGYGFIGNGSENAMFALRYRAYKEDTLKNIYIYFNPTSDDSAHNEIRFKLTVWNSLENEPGQIIYEETVRPFVNPSTKEFEKYSIDEEIILEGEFFIGWQQLKQNYLNVGLDKNNNVSGKAFINTNGYWSTSSISGAVMMRPGFGTPVISSANPLKFDNDRLKIYPNPAKEFVNIQLEDNRFNKNFSIEVIDLYGRSLIEEPFNYSKKLEISNLKSGIYIILLKDKTNILAKQKLLVE